MIKIDPLQQKLFKYPIFCGLSDLASRKPRSEELLVDKNCIMRYNYNVIVKLG